ncbi:MAG: vWA domain-containing protein, partial [Candidatus Saccharibacteria bacterium]
MAESGFNDSKIVGNYLTMYFNQDQGVRLGDSAVVSQKLHGLYSKRRGWVKIYSNQDAGKNYLKFVDEKQVIHIDVYHELGEIDPRLVARRIFRAVQDFLLEEEPSLKYVEDMMFRQAIDFCHKLMISTRIGSGSAYDLLQGHMDVPEDKKLEHVHILAKLKSEEYYWVLIIAEAAEEAILESGLKLSRVRGINHGFQKQPEADLSSFLPIPWRRGGRGEPERQVTREKKNRLVVKLAERLGSVTEVEEFLNSMSTNPLKRKTKDSQIRRWGEIDQLVDQLLNANVLKKSLFGYTLSKDGEALLDYVAKHHNELETEMRRSIRRSPQGSHRAHGPKQQLNRATRVYVTNHNKVLNLHDHPEVNGGNIAIPETIIQAKKACFRRGDEQFHITRDDICVYDRRSYVPVDVCLLMDASESMAGAKRHATCYLAEHMLLTSKDKLAVVTFQEMRGSVAVPFTRNNDVLCAGLARVVPSGLTPMASGIVKAVDLIIKSR